jgi:beta-phosphoglucomutase-like phosphatase (HAD superfamily)
MEHIKAIIFDCDGTLVDSEPAHHAAWQRAAQNQGYELSLEEYCSYVGYPTDVIAESLSKKIGKECSQEILKDKVERFLQIQLGGLPPIQHTVNFVHRLAQERERFNLRLGVASAAGKEEIHTHLKSLGIRSLFDVILSGRDDLEGYSDVEGVNKPKPYVYLHMAKVMNLMPSQCVVIEDSCSGVTAGVKAGCVTVAVPNSYSRKQDFSLADIKIESLGDMSVESFLNMVKALLISRTLCS